MPGWVFFHPDALPERWNGRASPVFFVPLLPDEVPFLFGGNGGGSDDSDDALLRLAARGVSASAIADELGISPRSAQRRLSRLRERCGVESKAELVAYLARRGF